MNYYTFSLELNVNPNIRSVVNDVFRLSGSPDFSKVIVFRKFYVDVYPRNGDPNYLKDISINTGNATLYSGRYWLQFPSQNQEVNLLDTDRIYVMNSVSLNATNASITQIYPSFHSFYDLNTVYDVTIPHVLESIFNFFALQIFIFNRTLSPIDFVVTFYLEYEYISYEEYINKYG